KHPHRNLLAHIASGGHVAHRDRGALKSPSGRTLRERALRNSVALPSPSHEHLDPFGHQASKTRSHRTPTRPRQHPFCCTGRYPSERQTDLPLEKVDSRRGPGPFLLRASGGISARTAVSPALRGGCRTKEWPCRKATNARRPSQDRGRARLPRGNRPLCWTDLIPAKIELLS